MVLKQTVLVVVAISLRIILPTSSFGLHSSHSKHSLHRLSQITSPKAKSIRKMSSMVSIRDVISSDVENLKTVVNSSELFPSDMLDDMISGFFAGTEDCLWLTTDSPDPTLITYCAPEKMTEGTWNLYLIAVHKSMQGTGIGTKALQHLEEQLVAKKGARILLVETSGLPEFEQTRKFYLKNNFVEEARIRDYYKDGEDKVVYWKSLVSK